MDYISITHESISVLQSSKKKTHWAPLKLDMSKAYDPMNLDYLQKAFGLLLIGVIH